MSRIFGLFLLALSAASVASLPTFKSSPVTFCNDLDCPEFTVVSKGEGFEVREYNATKYASTLISGSMYNIAVMKGFYRLYDYINGNNKQGKKMEMAVPVTVKVEQAQGQWFMNSNIKLTMSFFIPFADQANPPEPSDPAVFVNKMPQLTAYVSTFPGYVITGDGWVQHADELRQALNASSITNYEKSYFYTAGYDSPTKFFERHNEIWIPVA